MGELTEILEDEKVDSDHGFFVPYIDERINHILDSLYENAEKNENIEIEGEDFFILFSYCLSFNDVDIEQHYESSMAFSNILSYALLKNEKNELTIFDDEQRMKNAMEIIDTENYVTPYESVEVMRFCAEYIIRIILNPKPLNKELKKEAFQHISECLEWLSDYNNTSKYSRISEYLEEYIDAASVMYAVMHQPKESALIDNGTYILYDKQPLMPPG